MDLSLKKFTDMIHFDLQSSFTSPYRLTLLGEAMKNIGFFNWRTIKLFFQIGYISILNIESSAIRDSVEHI